ncbi:MAG: hypothetical protein RIK87_12000 [Fuerstiella sp.]
MKISEVHAALCAWQSESWMKQYPSWELYCAGEFGLSGEQVSDAIRNVHDVDVPVSLNKDQEYAATVLAEHLVSFASAADINAYPSDRAAVDAILTELTGHRVTLCYA